MANKVGPPKKSEDQKWHMKKKKCNFLLRLDIVQFLKETEGFPSNIIERIVRESKEFQEWLKDK